MSAERSSVLTSLAGAPIALRAVTLRGHADGSWFELAVEQHYAHDGDVPLDALYTLQMPPRAVLESFDYAIGVPLRELVRQHRADAAADGAYRFPIGDLPPGVDVAIGYRYAVPVDISDGVARLLIPRAVAPRYASRTGVVAARHRRPSRLRSARYPLSLTLSLTGELARGHCHSSTHRLIAMVSNEGCELRTVSDFVLDRDLVVLIEAQAVPSARPGGPRIDVPLGRSAPCLAVQRSPWRQFAAIARPSDDDGFDAACIVAALVTGAGQRAAIPSTLEELRVLGVGQQVLDALFLLVCDGHREAAVITAWLAEFAARHVAELDERFVRALARVAQRPIRDLIVQQCAAP